MKFLFFGKTKGVFAGFDLDGTTLEPDHSGIKVLYGTNTTNTEIEAGAETPAAAYKKGTYEDYVGQRGLGRMGKTKWRRRAADVLARLVAARNQTMLFSVGAT